MTWKLTVLETFDLGDRGVVATGRIEADSQPVRGPCTVEEPGKPPVDREAKGFEAFAIPNWWTTKFTCGVLLNTFDHPAVGSIIKSAEPK